MAKTAIVKKMPKGIEVYLLEDRESWSIPDPAADPASRLLKLGYVKASSTTTGDTEVEVWSNFQARRSVPPPLPGKP